MSIITDFYSGEIADHRGRALLDLQAQNFVQLEDHHDYIQWLFPLPEASRFNSHAPMLTDTDIAAFRSNAALRLKLQTSFVIMLHFYGLELAMLPNSVYVKKGDAWPDRSANWLTPRNHNYLRISRILRCLTVLGCEDRAVAFLACLERIYETHSRVIGDVTLRYWRDAVSTGHARLAHDD